MNRATRRADDASASRQKAEDELAALKLRQRGLMNSFQRLYLSSAEAPARASGAEPAAAAAPGDGLLTRQLTARRNQMLLRHAHLRPSLQTQAAKDLFETLEVLLIRLDVLAAQDARAAESFAALVRQSKLPERIDEVLAAAAESPEVRSWLMEARLILTGADRVG